MIAGTHMASLAWATQAQEEARFHRILSVTLALYVAGSVALSFVPITDIKRNLIADQPLRRATIALEPLPPQPIAVTIDPALAIAPIKTAPPAPPARAVTARVQAEHSGLLVLRTDLASLRRLPAVTPLPDQPLVSGTRPSAAIVEQSAITAAAQAVSGGITVTSNDTGGIGLAGRETTRVDSSVKVARGQVQSTSGGRTRSIEDIESIFDKNKSAIYALYNRALRADPTLHGKVVLKLLITPTGTVSECGIVSSELHMSEFERKLVARVAQFQFGAAAVGTIVVTYPYDFKPS